MSDILEVVTSTSSPKGTLRIYVRTFVRTSKPLMNKITNKFAFSSLKTCIFQIFVVILQRKIDLEEKLCVQSLFNTTKTMLNLSAN